MQGQIANIRHLRLFTYIFSLIADNICSIFSGPLPVFHKPFSYLILVILRSPCTKSKEASGISAYNIILLKSDYKIVFKRIKYTVRSITSVNICYDEPQDAYIRGAYMFLSAEIFVNNLKLVEVNKICTLAFIISRR